MSVSEQRLVKRLGFSLIDPCQFDILQSGLPAGDRMLDQLKRRDFITLLGSAAAAVDKHPR